MNTAEVIDNLIDKIISGEHVSAQSDIESVLAQKMQDALDAKKQEVAASIYGVSSEQEVDVEQSEEDNESTIENEPNI